MELNLGELVAEAFETAQIIEDTVELYRPCNQLVCNPDEFATLGDCDFPDHLQDPFRLVRYLFGNDAASSLEATGDLELISGMLRRWASIVQAALDNKERCLPGAQQGQRQEISSPAGRLRGRVGAQAAHGQ